MDRLLQQRLLGAAILLAVLVIVVPELLDGAGHRSRYPSSVDIPAVPAFKPMAEVDALPIEEPLIPAQPVLDSVTETMELPIPAPVIKTRPPEPEKITSVVASPPVTSPGQKPKTVKSTSVKPAWALQVGSFSEKPNALKMRDQFRGKGYSAYVEEAQGSFRVRIGPELDHGRMEKMLDKVLKQEKIKGMIVTHP